MEYILPAVILLPKSSHTVSFPILFPFLTVLWYILLSTRIYQNNDRPTPFHLLHRRVQPRKPLCYSSSPSRPGLEHSSITLRFALLQGCRGRCDARAFRQRVQRWGRPIYSQKAQLPLEETRTAHERAIGATNTT